MTLSIIAIIISAVAIGVSIWNARSDSRSATAAEDSAVTSRQSADHARDSAEYARASADAAERVAQAEVERDHEMYKPPQVGPEAFVIEHNPRTGEENLFCIFTPQRSYRISGDSIQDGSTSTLSMPLFNPAGKPVKVSVDEFRTTDEVSRKQELQLRFWPPAETDERDLWLCRCGRPLQSHEGPHWEMTVPVVTPARGPSFPILGH